MPTRLVRGSAKFFLALPGHPAHCEQVVRSTSCKSQDRTKYESNTAYKINRPSQTYTVDSSNFKHLCHICPVVCYVLCDITRPAVNQQQLNHQEHLKQHYPGLARETSPPQHFWQINVTPPDSFLLQPGTWVLRKVRDDPPLPRTLHPQKKVQAPKVGQQPMSSKPLQHLFSNQQCCGYSVINWHHEAYLTNDLPFTSPPSLLPHVCKP